MEAGKKFNRLIALYPLTVSRWMFQCECGNTKIADHVEVTRKRVQSCGCLQRQRAKENGANSKTHGQASKLTSTYITWKMMRQRCNNSNHTHYKDYGGRGIKCCDRWNSFENFLADMGERPEGLTLDRYPDINGNYEPSNCRWATRIEQANNRRPRLWG